MLLSVNEHDPRPIYLQIVAQIKEQIWDGTLRPGDMLPSVRELGDNLGINLHTVHKAYQILRDQGIIYLRLGQRARIAPLRKAPTNREQVEEELTGRLNDLVTEAFLLGLSIEDFKKLFDDVLERRHGGVL